MMRDAIHSVFFIFFSVISAQSPLFSSAMDITDTLDSVPVLASQGLSLEDFNSILISDVDELLGDASDADSMWKRASEHEWERLIRKSSESNESGVDPLFPFILCSALEGQDGFGRLNDLKQILPGLDTNLKAIEYIVNGNDKTCILTRLEAATAMKLAFLAADEEEKKSMIAIQPVISLSKMSNEDVDRILDWMEGDNANVESSTQTGFPNLYVGLCPGVGSAGDDKIGAMDGERIVREMKDFLLRKTETGTSILTKSFFWSNQDEITVEAVEGVQETISRRALKRDFWSEVFERGIDADGDDCAASIDQLSFQPSQRMQGISITSREGEMEGSKINKWCGLSLFAGLSLHDYVCSVEVRHEYRTLNVRAQWLTQSGTENSRPWFDAGLTGKGQVVAISDTGVDTDNCYFYDSNSTSDFKKDGNIYPSARKIVQYKVASGANSKDSKFGHGTHVCGTVAGRKAVDGKTQTSGAADGIAKDAKIAFIDIGADDGSLVVDVEDVLNTGEDIAHIHSASWGNTNNRYGSQAKAFDEHSWNNEDFLAVVAAGNSGGGNTFNTVGEPATAKNVLSVGAANSIGIDLQQGMQGPAYMAGFSSRGPSQDGRTLPLIVAPGKYILSAGAQPSEVGECDPEVLPFPGLGREGLKSMAGTSMATPVTSGSAALVRQYFEEGWYPNGVKESGTPFSPSGALVKAVLLNGAQYMIGVDNGGCDVYPVTPYDNVQNFGRVSLSDSLYISSSSNVDSEVYDKQSISGEEDTLLTELKIDQSKGCKASDFSATLVWMDIAATRNSRSPLINKIGLRVVKNSKTYFPNGKTEYDEINNAQRVRLNANNGDEFEVYVKGINLVSSQVQYAVAITGCFGEKSVNPNTEPNVYLNSSEECGRSIWKPAVIGAVSVIAGMLMILALNRACVSCRKRQYAYDYSHVQSSGELT
mmetsp:Transcript_44862/g.65927  ORF Transcript_44862/g.65927 Transcript_44862/m.65927 type:complete len:933 (+) Transcript_44862:60-2858(+)